MIKLLKLDIDREWTAKAEMTGSAKFEKDGHEFNVKLSHYECQAISDLIDRRLLEVAELQTQAQLEALKVKHGA